MAIDFNKNLSAKNITIMAVAILAILAVPYSWWLSNLNKFNISLQKDFEPVIADCESLINRITSFGNNASRYRYEIIQLTDTLGDNLIGASFNLNTSSAFFSRVYKNKVSDFISIWVSEIKPDISDYLSRQSNPNITVNTYRNLNQLDSLCMKFKQFNSLLNKKIRQTELISNCIYAYIICVLLYLIYMIYSHNYRKSTPADHNPGNRNNAFEKASVNNILDKAGHSSLLQKNLNYSGLSHKTLAQLIEEPESIELITSYLYKIESLLTAESSAIFIPTTDMASQTILTCTDSSNPEWSYDIPSSFFSCTPADFDSNEIKTIFLNDTTEYKYICVRLPLSANDYSLLVLKTLKTTEITDSILTELLAHTDRLSNIVSSYMLVRLKLRHAHYEERAVIARELHDSLAQSLSYLKIQASRLQNIVTNSDLQTNSKSMEIDSLMQDLRTNLNVAYRHLRDLISTFRLTMGGKNFNQSLNDSVSEFAKRSGIAFDIDNRLPSNFLSITQETQLLYIIREALSNVVRHSHAKYALISIHYNDSGQVKASVTDDGIGLPDISERTQNFGIIIMQERAHSIDGSISLEESSDGGTCLTVTFQASK